MKTPGSTIALRPRFKFDIKQNNEELLNLFEATKSVQSSVVVSRIDDHVFIKIPKAKQHFWSPQLHLEINNHLDKEGSCVHGLFGPNPTVWTLFMFFHFVVAGLFTAFLIWAYVNWSLHTGYALQLFGVLFMIAIWFILYFGGRIGRRAGLEQMHELHEFMKDTLKQAGIHAEL